MNVIITFEQELNVISVLLDLLEREQKCLIRTDMQTIQSLADEKTKLLEKLDALSQARYKTLSSIGFAGSESGMSDWLKSLGENEPEPSWQILQKQLSRVKELNRLNGILIIKRFLINQETLNVLHGKQGGNIFYGPDGLKTTSSNHRTSLVG
jgi:flagella synthesis protein FlgN